MSTVEPDWALAAALGVLGLVIGSFLNVVIWRVPRGESVVSPGSHCPGCEHRLSAVENIPVVSWLALRGRCRHCGQRISARYPAVEILTGAVFAVLALRFGASWELPAYLYLGAIGVTLALIDLDVKRLPNAIVMPAYVVLGALLLLPAALDPAWGAYLRGWLGAVALLAFYLVLALAYPAGMGLGDVKLAGVLGLALAWLGWGELLVGGFLGFALGALVGLGLMAARRAGRRTALPFGPFMLAGALLAVLWGAPMAAWYLGLIGLGG